MPECSYCRKSFPSVGLGGDDHNWLICASDRVVQLEGVLKAAFAAMGVANCIDAVRAEYDFTPVMDQIKRTLSPKHAPVMPLRCDVKAAKLG